MKKDHNLNNPNSEPEHTATEVTCTVHFEGSGKVPVDKLSRWLLSLPKDATVKFTGMWSGKASFEATWTETR